MIKRKEITVYDIASQLIKNGSGRIKKGGVAQLWLKNNTGSIIAQVNIPTAAQLKDDKNVEIERKII
jgi:hypothetical protein